MLIGRHDFTSFKAAKTSVEQPVRQVYVAQVRQEGDHLLFEIIANGFLRHMVRIIVGTLLDIGREKLTPGDLKVILEAKDRNKASKTASAHALCLLEVSYESFHLKDA